MRNGFAARFVDARKGLLSQTHRHAIIASLLGIRHVVLAVNKIDLVGFDRATAMSSARMYFHTSSSVQFDSGNTRMYSQTLRGALNSRHSTGR